MFLSATMNRNPALIEAAFALHRAGKILPDTYLVDVDAFRENARRIKRAADSAGIRLYGMTKQLGRNPALAAILLDEGYDGIVTVDFKEALLMLKNGLHLGHVGHLVQLPRACVREILSAAPDVATVFSVEKAREISDAARSLGRCQPVLLRPRGEGDVTYPGQECGFALDRLPETVKQLAVLSGIRIAGVTSFPCFQYDEETDAIRSMPNMDTLIRARDMLVSMGFSDLQVNAPSANCCQSMPLLRACGATHAEPGHALTGTTPYHVLHEAEELPALVYVSEVSHRAGGHAFCYGGGHYRRSHMQNALVGKSAAQCRTMRVLAPEAENIDYHFALSEDAEISDTVVMAFRTQVFVTRSSVALLEGLSAGQCRLTGLYTADGTRLE